VRTGQARKRDTNENAIVEALEAVGAFVFRISGEGTPDLLVAWRGKWVPLEVKSKTGDLTERQSWTFRQAQATAPIPTVRTPAEALKAIGVSDQFVVPWQPPKE